MGLIATMIWASLGAAPAPQRIEWSIVDVAQQRTFTVKDEATKLTAGGQLDVSPEGSQLKLAVRYQPGKRGTTLRVQLADQSGQDRGLVVRLSLPVDGEGWRWWQELDTPLPLADKPLSNTTPLRGLPGLPEFPQGERPEYGQYSVYPLGVVEQGGRWLALARPISQLALVRFIGAGAPERRLSAEVDLALSEYTRPPREAEFSLWFLSGEAKPAASMRAALTRYYDFRPEDWQVRVPIFGGWMPFWDLAKLPNVDEFGFAYQEGGANPGFDDRLGALSFVYFHCAGEFANVPGYQRGTQPLPSYEQIIAAFNTVAEQHSGVANAWDACGIRNADGKIAYQPEKTYGDFFCQACVDPDVPYGKAMADRLLKIVTAKPVPEGIDGVYYDGVAAGLDYAPEHLRVADHLLLWDGKLNRPVNYNLWSSAEWARYIHDQLGDTKKLTMLNDSSLASFHFVESAIDVPGAEMSIFLDRPTARLIRIFTRHKPFCTLVKADFRQFSTAHIETYMRRCVAYGILPGFFDISPSGDNPGSSYWEHPEWYDRDRPLFTRYMPLARELAAAGWEPVTLAEAPAGEADVERFGPKDAAGLTYLTVSTDPREKPEEKQPVTVGLPRESLSDASHPLAVELLTGRIEKTGPKLTQELTGEDLAVWALGTPQQQARACVARARDVLERRQRYVEACRAGGSQLSPWTMFGEGTAQIASPGHDSANCVQVDKDKAGTMVEVTQTINVSHDRPRRLIVSAWSKAENVTGEKSQDYSLYVDLYYTDGKALYGQTVDFATGTHDWQFGERTIEPEKPIRNINVYLLFRGPHTGRVWFDDVKVALADEPDKNLLQRGNFEPEAGARPLVGEGPEAKAIGGNFGQLLKLIGADLASLDWARADAVIAQIEQTARKANWGADSERALRDASELRWHLRLARACLRGQPQPPQRTSRLTELVMLGAPRRAAAPMGAASAATRASAATAKLPPGTLVAVDSSFDEYGPGPLSDGQINPVTGDWTQVAWASDETAEPHWIELHLPKPMAVRQVRLWWAADSGRLHVSKQVEVQIKHAGPTSGPGKWVRAEVQKAETSDPKGLTTITLTGPAVQDLRLWQPAHGGSVLRPDLMWVTEVEVEAP